MPIINFLCVAAPINRSVLFVEDLSDFILTNAMFYRIILSSEELLPTALGRGGAMDLIKFTKMQASGNDYIVIDCTVTPIGAPSALAVAMSRRRMSVGADGIVLIVPSEIADVGMRMYNADGSEGLTCGNALRMTARYLYDRKRCGGELDIETLSGVRRVRIITDCGKVISVSAEMGRASRVPADIPAVWHGETVTNVPVDIDGDRYSVTALSVGNPHAVIFCARDELLLCGSVGAKLERHPMFPDRVNVEFANLRSDGSLEVRVFERGSGETGSCGSGACAAVAAAHINGYIESCSTTRVVMPGGDMRVTCDASLGLTLEGAVETVYEGMYPIGDASEACR